MPHRSVPGVNPQFTINSELPVTSHWKLASKLGILQGLIVKSIWSLVYLAAWAVACNSSKERWQMVFTFLLTTTIFQVTYLSLWLNPFVYLNCLPFFMHCLGFIAIYGYLSSIAIHHLKLLKPQVFSVNLCIILLVAFLAFVVSSIEFIIIAPVLDGLKTPSTVNLLNSGFSGSIMFSYLSCFTLARVSIVCILFIALNYALQKTTERGRQIASAMMLGITGGVMLIIPQWLI